MPENSSGGPVRSWLRENSRDTFGSADFLVAVVAGVATWALTAASSPIEQSSSVPVAVAGIGATCVAIVAVTLTALAIIVGLLDALYSAVLEQAGGIGKAFQPFVTVAVVAGVGAVASILSLILWDWRYPRPVLLGVNVLFGVWSVWGSVQLVQITAFLGRQRFELLGAVRDARTQLRQVRPDPDPDSAATA